MSLLSEMRADWKARKVRDRLVEAPRRAGEEPIEALEGFAD
jgi:hypothetical protein